MSKYLKKMGNYANPITGTDDSFYKGGQNSYVNTDPNFFKGAVLTPEQQNSLDITSDGFYKGGESRSNRLNILPDPSAMLSGKMSSTQQMAMDKMSKISGVKTISDMLNNTLKDKLT